MIVWPSGLASITPLGWSIVVVAIATGLWLIARDVIAARRERPPKVNPTRDP